MARYYFDIKDEEGITPDAEGLERVMFGECKMKPPGLWLTWREMLSA